MKKNKTIFGKSNYWDGSVTCQNCGKQHTRRTAVLVTDKSEDIYNGWFCKPYRSCAPPPAEAKNEPDIDDTIEVIFPD
jgi:transcription elongation factor Elf1